MKLVMTLLARDEADVVDAQVAFHLHAGVDFVVATDNGSQDGTRQVLDRYERVGVLRLLHEPGRDMRQEKWVTRMARLAATEHGADWVVNADADEFWWPRGGSLKDVLATIPDRFGIVRGCWRHFLPRPEGDAFFAERMTVRLCTPAHPGDKETIYHAHQKVAHRASPAVVVQAGNHGVEAPGLEPFRFWHPIEVLHFSIRSGAQLESKAQGGWLRNVDYEPTLHQLLLDAAYREGRVGDYYRSLVAGDERVARGLADGSLAVDTRLRDALRAIRDPETGAFALPGSLEPLRFPRPGVEEDAVYAGEASVLEEIDATVRAERRVDTLEECLARLEGGYAARLRALRRRLDHRPRLAAR
jgi:hypothetical protein